MLRSRAGAHLLVIAYPMATTGWKWGQPLGQFCPVALTDAGARALPRQKWLFCRWLDPLIVARIEFLKWTPENRLRDTRLAGIRTDKNAHEVAQEDDLPRLCALKLGQAKHPVE